MEKILIVGDDFHLLATRAAILSKTGSKVTCCNASEFADHLGNDSFGLVVLCHTLAEDTRDRIVGDTHRRWPNARLLEVASLVQRRYVREVDAETASEPGKLLENACRLLNLDTVH
jgi:hypothetical protein